MSPFQLQSADWVCSLLRQRLRRQQGHRPFGAPSELVTIEGIEDHVTLMTTLMAPKRVRTI